MFELLCCKYLAKNTTKISTSTQKSTITTTQLTSNKKQNITKVPSIKPTTQKYTKTTAGIQITDSQITTTTTAMNTITESSEVTTDPNWLNKGPRFGENNITESIPNDDQTTTSMDGIITLMTTIGGSSDLFSSQEITKATETTTESIDHTTLIPPIGNVTKRPATRVDTTLEGKAERPSTTEIITEMSTNNPILTMTTTDIPDEITDSDVTTENVTWSILSDVRRKCASRNDCGLQEMCINRECLKICQTNDNVTKSDDCVQGT